MHEKQRQKRMWLIQSFLRRDEVCIHIKIFSQCHSISPWRRSRPVTHQFVSSLNFLLHIFDGKSPNIFTLRVRGYQCRREKLRPVRNRTDITQWSLLLFGDITDNDGAWLIKLLKHGQFREGQTFWIKMLKKDKFQNLFFFYKIRILPGHCSNFQKICFLINMSQ